MAFHILELLRSALVHYGYWAVAAVLLLENAGIPMPGETVLLLASFLAYSERELRLPWIMVTGAIAATLGDNCGYLLGYRGGRPLLLRYQHIFLIRDATLAHGEKLFAHYGSVTVFFARFIFGMRVIAGPLAGVLRMPWKKFALFNLLGAVIWVTVISLAGYFFGSQWNRLLHDLGRLNLILAAAFVLIVAGLWWMRRRRPERD